MTMSIGKEVTKFSFTIKKREISISPGWLIFQWFHFIAFTGMYFCPVPLHCKPYSWWLNDSSCCECFQTATPWNKNPLFSSFSNHHRHAECFLSCPLWVLVIPAPNWNREAEFPVGVCGRRSSWCSFQQHVTITASPLGSHPAELK